MNVNDEQQALAISAVGAPWQRHLRLNSSYLWPAALLALTLLTYAGVLRAGLVSDDMDQLYTMAHMSWGDTIGMFVPRPLPPDANPRFYRPLGFLLWKVGWWLGGYEPLPQHVLSVVLHGLNGALVYALGRRVLGLSRPAAFCAGALFVVFPLDSEAVAWASSRFDLAATAGSLSALLFALGARSALRGAALGCVCLVLALSAKESAAVVPALALLLLFLCRGDRSARTTAAPVRSALLRVAPLALVVLAYLGVRWAIFGGIGGYMSDGRPQSLQLSPAQLGESLAALAVFLSAPLNWLWLVSNGWPSVPQGLLPAAACAGLVAWALRPSAAGDSDAYTRGGLAGDAVLWLGWGAIAWLPVLGLPVNPLLPSSSRFAYLPCVGVCLALARLIFRLQLAAWSRGQARPLRGWRPALVATTVALCCLMLQGVNGRWLRAGSQVQAVLDQVQAAVPVALPQTTLLLPTLPDHEQGAYVLRNGVESALRMRYGQPLLRAAVPAGDTPAPLARPDRVYQLVWRDDTLALHPQQQQLAEQWAAQGYAPGLPALSWTGEFYPREQSAEHRWNWLRRAGCLSLKADARAQRVDLRLRLWSLAPSVALRVTLDGVPLARRVVTPQAQELALPGLALGAGEHCVGLEAERAQQADALLHNGDRREVSVAVGDVALSLSPTLAAPPAPQHALAARFEPGITLLGYDLQRAPGALGPEQQLVLTLYWRCERPINRDLVSFVHLADASGHPLAQADAPPAGLRAGTITWRAGDWMRGVFVLTLPQQAPRNYYTLLTGLYDARTHERLRVGASDVVPLETLLVW